MPRHALSFSTSDLISRSLRQQEQPEDTSTISSDPTHHHMQQSLCSDFSPVVREDMPTLSESQPPHARTLSHSLLSSSKTSGQLFPPSHYQHFFPINPIAAILKTHKQTPNPLIYATPTGSYDLTWLLERLVSTCYLQSLSSQCLLSLLYHAFTCTISPAQLSSEVTYALHIVKFSNQF